MQLMSFLQNKRKPLIVSFFFHILLVVWKQNCCTGIQQCVKQIWGSELVNDPKTLMREGEGITMGNNDRFFYALYNAVIYLTNLFFWITKQVVIELCQAQGKLKLVWLWLGHFLLLLSWLFMNWIHVIWFCCFWRFFGRFRW